MAAISTETDRATTLSAYLTAIAPKGAELQISVGHEAEEPSSDLHLRLSGSDDAADLLVAGQDRLRLVARAVPWSEVPQRLGRLVKAYQVERCMRDTFRTWAGNLSEHDLSERLGLPRNVNG